MNNQENLLEELNELLEKASASSIRKSVTHVYHDYIYKNHQMLPFDFITIASNINNLIEFLENLEEINLDRNGIKKEDC